MTRDQFRDAVFTRDGHRCVVCHAPAVDSHHLIDRSLWDDGGYWVDNGVSLCADHHLQAEKTVLSCKELRESAGITNVILPEHFFHENEYDHWGNIVLPNGSRLRGEHGSRLRGELFDRPSVQDLLKEAGVLFLPYVKYSRTYHVPWTGELHKDDRILEDLSRLIGTRIIMTEKVDGEGTSMYPDHCHARSLDSEGGEDRSWVKKLHGSIAYQIPAGYRICGENLFAKHSIHYHNLRSYFYVFSIWDEKNNCLSWDETVEYCELLDLIPVPVLFDGICPDEKSLRDLIKRAIRWVRPGHVQTTHHWRSKEIIPNEISPGASR